MCVIIALLVQKAKAIANAELSPEEMRLHKKEFQYQGRKL